MRDYILRYITLSNIPATVTIEAPTWHGAKMKATGHLTDMGWTPESAWDTHTPGDPLTINRWFFPIEGDMETMKHVLLTQHKGRLIPKLYGQPTIDRPTY